MLRSKHNCKRMENKFKIFIRRKGSWQRMAKRSTIKRFMRTQSCDWRAISRSNDHRRADDVQLVTRRWKGWRCVTQTSGVAFRDWISLHVTVGFLAVPFHILYIVFIKSARRLGLFDDFFLWIQCGTAHALLHNVRIHKKMICRWQPPICKWCAHFVFVA